MSKATRFSHRHKKAFALVTTMLLIALMIAAAAQLATLTATESIVTKRRVNGLQHELAVDSALLLLADELTGATDPASWLIRDLDQLGRAVVRFEVGAAKVTCTILDDGAKFNPNLFRDSYERTALTRKINILAARNGLASVEVQLQPLPAEQRSASDHRRYLWFDQVLVDVDPASIFSWKAGLLEPTVVRTWSHVMTFWGDGRVDLRRAEPEVLDAVLEDIRPNLARLLLANRPADRTVDFSGRALAAVDAEIRQRVTSRLTWDAKRYAIRMDTMVDADTRRWYVVARIDNNEIEVYHRSGLTW